MQTVNELDYAYRKLVVKAREKRNNTIDITEEDYAKYYEVEPEPVEPIPGSDIPIPDEEDPNHDYSQDYLTFEALEDGTFSFTVNDLYYSTNNGASWKSLAAGTETELITKGTKVLWKRDSVMKNSYTNYTNTSNRTGIGIFSSTGQFNISGNILSLAIDEFTDKLLSSDNDNYKNYFQNLFKDCINLISAKNLIFPNQNLTKHTYGCGYYFAGIYSSMFNGCSNLIYAPKILPSTNLADDCYLNMFSNCTSLLVAPELPKIYFASNENLKNMFNNCTSLKYIKCLTIPDNNNFTDWVKGVPAGGKFIKNSQAVWNIGPSGIPAGWEVIDEVVPEEGE